MNKTIYRIKITGFDEHQEKLKKGHKAILIKTNFLDHPSIRSQTPTGVLLFLSCLLLAGESTSSQIEVNHESLCFQSRVKSGSLRSQLDQLQSLQLLTYEVLPSLINRKEKKVIEKKVIEKKLPQSQENQESEKDQNAKIWQAYFNAFRIRYGVEPVRNATVNSQISSIRKRLGLESAIKVACFYIKHNDSFYLKSMHSVGLLLRDCESLHTQMQRGASVTGNQAREMEKRSNVVDQVNFFKDLANEQK